MWALMNPTRIRCWTRIALQDILFPTQVNGKSVNCFPGKETTYIKIVILKEVQGEKVKKFN